jgi:hypothetical protein
MDEELEKINQEALASFRESDEFADAQIKKAELLFKRLLADFDNQGLKISHLIDCLCGYFHERGLDELDSKTEQLLKLLPEEN